MSVKKSITVGIALFALMLSDTGRSVVPVVPGAMKSTLTLVNPGAVATHATIRFYDGSGQLAASRPRTLPPHGAVSLPVPVSGFEGSAGVVADQPILALVVDATDDNKAREIYEGMGTAAQLSFPIFRHLGSSARSSIISVQNPSTASEVEVTLRYFDKTGLEQGSATQTLAPSARYDFDSATLFGTTSRTYTPNGQLFGFPFCENIVKRPETTALNAHDHPRIDRTTTGRTL